MHETENETWVQHTLREAFVRSLVLIRDPLVLSGLRNVFIQREQEFLARAREAAAHYSSSLMGRPPDRICVGDRGLIEDYYTIYKDYVNLRVRLETYLKDQGIEYTPYEPSPPSSPGFSWALSDAFGVGVGPLGVTFSLTVSSMSSRVSYSHTIPPESVEYWAKRFQEIFEAGRKGHGKEWRHLGWLPPGEEPQDA